MTQELDAAEGLIHRLKKDEAKSAKLLSRAEVSFLVDAYYMMQNNRIRAGHQANQLFQADLPNEVITWLFTQNQTIENQIKRALKVFCDHNTYGDWPMAVVGVGPVTTAGLIAHINIEKAPTVGHIWSFAGLDPQVEWKKGEKRPWNARLKTLCAFKIGESFVKNKNREGCLYGQIYDHRKEFEARRNADGYNKEAAKLVLEKKRIGKTTQAYGYYSKGLLPPAHIHARARRYAVKMFLSHLQMVWYKLHYGREAPYPYPIRELSHEGHRHLLLPDGTTIDVTQTPTAG